MTYSEEMEKLGQVTIFDLLPPSPSNVFSIGDSVRVVITAESDSESYHYLEAYHPIVLKKRGEIIEIQGNQQYLVLSMLRVTGEAKLKVRYEVQLPITEAEFEAMSERQANALIEEHIDWLVTLSSAETEDIEVWDYDSEE
ncbi:hypothetical protein MHH70_01780 [Metasolibacillus sp. FSL H7-0170]|uniref:hypothetical protein n=1 Tax=Metasolibacillus sp. FSL H7-0170 TaxID=2921431 RepID=UPI00315832D5